MKAEVDHRVHFSEGKSGTVVGVDAEEPGGLGKGTEVERCGRPGPECFQCRNAFCGGFVSVQGVQCFFDVRLVGAWEAMRHGGACRDDGSMDERKSEDGGDEWYEAHCRESIVHQDSWLFCMDLAKGKGHR